MMLYLAQPYSSHDPKITTFRAQWGMNTSACLLKDGWDVYSPIAHWHHIAFSNNLPTDFSFWQSHNRHMIAQSKAFAILRLPGWTSSIGVKAEIEYAQELFDICHYVDPSYLTRANIFTVQWDQVLKDLADGEDITERGAGPDDSGLLI